MQHNKTKAHSNRGKSTISFYWLTANHISDSLPLAESFASSMSVTTLFDISICYHTKFQKRIPISIGKVHADDSVLSSDFPYPSWFTKSSLERMQGYAPTFPTLCLQIGAQTPRHRLTPEELCLSIKTLETADTCQKVLKCNTPRQIPIILREMSPRSTSLNAWVSPTCKQWPTNTNALHTHAWGCTQSGFLMTPLPSYHLTIKT